MKPLVLLLVVAGCSSGNRNDCTALAMSASEAWGAYAIAAKRASDDYLDEVHGDGLPLARARRLNLDPIIESSITRAQEEWSLVPKHLQASVAHGTAERALSPVQLGAVVADGATGKDALEKHFGDKSELHTLFAKARSSDASATRVCANVSVEGR